MVWKFHLHLPSNFSCVVVGYGLLVNELINHLVQTWSKVTKKLCIVSLLDVHGLVILILSSAHHEVEYLFEVACNHTPFILACKTVLHMRQTTYIHDCCQDFLPLWDYCLKLVSIVHFLHQFYMICFLRLHES